MNFYLGKLNSISINICHSNLHECREVLLGELLAGRLPLALEVDVVVGQPLEALLNSLGVPPKPVNELDYIIWQQWKR